MAEYVKLVAAGQMAESDGRLTKGITQVLFVSGAADFHAAVAQAPKGDWDLSKSSASEVDINQYRGNPDWEEVEVQGEGLTLFKHMDRVFGT